MSGVSRRELLVAGGTGLGALALLGLSPVVPSPLGELVGHLDALGYGYGHDLEAVTNAVAAFQKQEGLGITGRSDDATLARAREAQRPVARTREGWWLEVSLPRQVALLARDGRTVAVLSCSTADDRIVEIGGRQVRCDTPPGRYRTRSLGPRSRCLGVEISDGLELLPDYAVGGVPGLVPFVRSTTGVVVVPAAQARLWRGDPPRVLVADE